MPLGKGKTSTNHQLLGSMLVFWGVFETTTQKTCLLHLHELIHHVLLVDAKSSSCVAIFSVKTLWVSARMNFTQTRFSLGGWISLSFSTSHGVKSGNTLKYWKLSLNTLLVMLHTPPSKPTGFLSKPQQTGFFGGEVPVRLQFSSDHSVGIFCVESLILIRG